jgi:hypothetical protein
MLEEEWVKEHYYISENDLALAKTKATKQYSDPSLFCDCSFDSRSSQLT